MSNTILVKTGTTTVYRPFKWVEVEGQEDLQVYYQRKWVSVIYSGKKDRYGNKIFVPVSLSLT